MPLVAKEEKLLCERLRQITPQTRLLRVDEATSMLRDMYADYRRRPLPAFTAMVQRALDTAAKTFVPRQVHKVRMPAVPGKAPTPEPADTGAAAATATTESAKEAQEDGDDDVVEVARKDATPRDKEKEREREREKERQERQKRIEEAGSMLNNALVEGYKRAVCYQNDTSCCWLVVVFGDVADSWCSCCCC